MAALGRVGRDVVHVSRHAAFEGEDEKGDVIIYYVKTIADDKVEDDGNHPWAGERINFFAKIENVRSAKEEEISHKDVNRVDQKN